MLRQRTFRRDDFTSQLIEWLILGQTAMNPLILPVSILVTQCLAIDAEQIGKLQRPVVVELRPLEQFVDELGPAIGPPISKEGRCFIRRRQRADEIEIGSPQKSRIVTDIRRRDVEL